MRALLLLAALPAAANPGKVVTPTVPLSAVPSIQAPAAFLAFGPMRVFGSDGASLPTLGQVQAGIQAQALIAPPGPLYPAVQDLIDRAHQAVLPEAKREVLAGFDGLSAPGKEAVLNGLEQLARAEQRVEPRRALEALVVREELAQAEPRVRGRALTPERREQVVAATSMKDVKWHSFITNDIVPLPNGVTYPDNRIVMLARKRWRDNPSYTGYLRVLFSHEYVHRLQNEGEATRKYGGEIPAVSAELLRAVELFGLDGLRNEAVSFISTNVLGEFERGAAWAGKPEGPTDRFFWRGFLAGAAYGAALKTGRWADAWRFHRLVANEELRPADALRKVQQE